MYYKVNARNGRKVDAKASVENARKVARLQSKGHAPAWNLGTLPKKWYFVPKIILIYCEMVKRLRFVFEKVSVENARKVVHLQSKGHAPASNMGTLSKEN